MLCIMCYPWDFVFSRDRLTNKNCIACVRGAVEPLVGTICTICTNQIANVTIGKEIGKLVKMVIPLVPMVQMLPTNGTIGRTPNTRIVSTVSLCAVMCDVLAAVRSLTVHHPQSRLYLIFVGCFEVNWTAVFIKVTSFKRKFNIKLY